MDLYKKVLKKNVREKKYGRAKRTVKKPNIKGKKSIRMQRLSEYKVWDS